MTSTERDILKHLRTVHRRVAMWYYLAIGFGWIGVQTGFLVLLVPRVADNYEGMDVALPRFTLTLLSASKWMAGDVAGLGVPGWVLAVPAAVIILLFSAALLRRVTVLLTLIPIVAILALIAQLFLLLAPLYQMTESLTQ